MTNILDSVEPDAFRYNKVRGLNKEPFGTEYSEAPPRQNPGLTEQCSSVDPLYSRETVESIIEAVKAETRKQVLLEAAEVIRPKPVFCAMTTEILHATSALHKAANELRRMAEGEK